ncbi:MAG TPA: 3-keto-5-aminohexanoate cleavage protein, partial [Mycobacterium sp.]|nr:3-keto-5-aminohexanoate cleavage protein [Mycobacterium sp.]
TTAVAGRVAREAESGIPASFPVDFDGFQQAAVDVLEAGACGVHVDFGGLPAIQNSGLSVTEAYDKLIPAIRAATSRDCVFDTNVLRGENFAENVYPLTAGLAETVPMAPNFPVPWMEAVAKVVEQRDARLFFSIHSTAEVDLAHRLILRKKLAPQPACWLMLIGYQYDYATDRLATYLAHPKAMLTELIQIVDRIREIDPAGFVAVCAAGRAGHYLATAAMLLGLHVRVGTEDTVYRYPHRDELVHDNREMVDRVAATTAATLGRRLPQPANTATSLTCRHGSMETIVSDSNGSGHHGPPPGAHLYSRDGFVGDICLALRPHTIYEYTSAAGQHAPKRLVLGDIETSDRTDPLALPTPFAQSRNGVVLSVSTRTHAMPYAFRNAECDEMHFIQEGEFTCITDFGVLQAGPGDFVGLGRTVTYRVEPTATPSLRVILETPEVIQVKPPAPMGMVNFARDFKHPVVKPGVDHGETDVWIKSFDGITRFVTPHDPLACTAIIDGVPPAWQLNLTAIAPLAYPNSGGPPAQFAQTKTTDVMLYTLSAR